MSRYFLGVDGGQSTTTALIGDETGRVIGEGRAGPSNYPGAADGRAKFVAAMTECLGSACTQAGLDPAMVRFESACLGFSGGPADKELMLGEIVRSDRTKVTHDALIALAGATDGKPGVVVIAGTGSIAFGRNSEGRTARAGGWGYLFGDEGGGFWIARQAIRAAMRFEEGWGVPTSLRARLVDAAGTRNVNDLVHRAYTPEFDRPRLASLALLVNEAAEAGDPVAANILDDAGRELALLAIAVQSQLFANNGRARVSYSGGVFRSRLLSRKFREWMASESGVAVTAPEYGPAEGALVEAYSMAGRSVHLRWRCE
jgi:N-acetylglucosamine kinase-like BadF-type ATPase